jgi:hypothetical protein
MDFKDLLGKLLQQALKPPAADNIHANQPPPHHPTEHHPTEHHPTEHQHTRRNFLRLFLVTSHEAANSIVRTQRIYRSKTGSVGGGIYFARSRHEAALKGHHHGQCLSADVELGRMLEVSINHLNKYTYAELKKFGYDSVHLTGASGGEEFVVYNYSQVKNIKKV